MLIRKEGRRGALEGGGGGVNETRDQADLVNQPATQLKSAAQPSDLLQTPCYLLARLTSTDTSAPEATVGGKVGSAGPPSGVACPVHAEGIGNKMGE